MDNIHLINWGLIKHPTNWIVLFLMVYIFTFGASLLMGGHNMEKK